MMRTILSTLFCCLIAASSANAETVILVNPTANSPSGTQFTTTHTIDGTDATVDILHTLNAFATNTTVNGIGAADTVTEFGVNSSGDANGSQRRTIDGDKGEQVSVTGLSLANFNAGTSGLSLSDLSVSFATLNTLNGNNVSDGAFISFTDFNTDNDVNNNENDSGATPLVSVDLTSLTGFTTAAGDLFIQPNTLASNNRFSITEIIVDLQVGSSNDGMLGDVNCDGSVDLFDIAPFIALLTSSGTFEDKADIDRNGEVNLFDIAPFITLLTGN